MIRVTCRCGKILNAGDEHAGRQAKCPACGEVLTVPHPQAEAGQPQPPPAAGMAPGTPFL